MRTTVQQAQLSRIPQALGLCVGDVPGLCAYLNEAQPRLINAGGETGFWGGWTKVVFNVNRCTPYITLPRPYARAINMDVCRTPIRIQNEFYEELEAGIGLQGFNACADWCGALEGYERGVFPTLRDLDANQFLRVYITDPRDVGLRMLIGGFDQNGNPLYSQDGNNSVTGFYLTFTQPFATSNFMVTGPLTIQKDVTFGDVELHQVDATTGAEVLLSRYAAQETTPAYRRYFIHKLPCSCGPVLSQSPCVPGTPAVSNQVPVTAMCKYEVLPVSVPTDFLIIGNLAALKEECLSIRYGEMDAPNAAGMAQQHHARAIKLLQDEMRHYLGELQPAVNFAPFGTAFLSRPMSAVRNG